MLWRKRLEYILYNVVLALLDCRNATLLDVNRIPTSPRSLRVYGASQTPYARVLAAREVTAKNKARPRARHARLNPFQLGREIERQKRRLRLGSFHGLEALVTNR